MKIENVKLLELNWANLKDEILSLGSTVATEVKCYGIIWTLNPCRVVGLDDDDIAVGKRELVSHLPNASATLHTTSIFIR